MYDGPHVTCSSNLSSAIKTRNVSPVKRKADNSEKNVKTSAKIARTTVLEDDKNGQGLGGNEFETGDDDDDALSMPDHNSLDENVKKRLQKLY